MKSVVWNSKIAMIASLPLWIGCAGPVKQSATTASLGASTKPTYTEKVRTQTASNYRSKKTCPHDSRWQTEGWRELTQTVNACVGAKNWRQVRAMGDFLAIQAPTTPWGAYFLGLEASARKDYLRATWMLELALKKSPQEGLFHYELGRVRWMNGDSNGARESLIKASELNETLTQAHVFVAQIALVDKNFSRAEKYLKKALIAEPRNWTALMGMSQVATSKQDWVAAEDYLQRAVKSDPRQFQSRWALANLYEKQLNNLSQAIDTYKDIEKRRLTQGLDDVAEVNVQEKIKALEAVIAQRKSTVSNRHPSSGPVKEKVAQ